ncbi:TVP38/TMEM64 family protein [Klenkia taihuensis]|uniref:TVP38/TMEM64 family protein n=1 Tax=Klenkia taihuensis TaxID=1225127 RepID=UPI0013F65723|nr:VTT domain-containing protein [Klenkia taihuensis]
MSRGEAVRAVLLLAILLAGAVVALTTDLPTVDQLRDRVADAGLLGWAAIAGGTAVAVLAPIPRTALALLTGILLGFWPGLLVTVVGALVGALLGFGLGRALGRDTVLRLAGPRLRKADQLAMDRGFTAVLLARLTPVLPFFLVNYAGGLSGVRLPVYLAATFVGLLPGAVFNVAVGSVAGGLGEWGLAITVGPAAVVLAVLGVRWWRRRGRSTPVSATS